MAKKSGLALPRKIGLFVDDGCRNIGVLNWAKLIDRSPETELILLDAPDLAAGKLAGIDVLLCPGGGSARQLRAMQEAGRNAVRRFVADGGNYLGICAGCYNILNNESRLQMLPYDYDLDAVGKTAHLAVELNKPGARRLGVKAGTYVIRYSGGPIMHETAPLDGGESETLAVFRSSVSEFECAPHDFRGTPAIISGTYGKGKVIASSVHPESLESTQDIACGCLFAACGVKVDPVAPVKMYRPLRVGYYGAAIIGKRCIENMLELDRHPEVDVTLISLNELDCGVLNHLDILVVPHGLAVDYRRQFAPGTRKNLIAAFLSRGGRIIASGNGYKYLPKGDGILKIRAGKSFLPFVLQ